MPSGDEVGPIEAAGMIKMNRSSLRKIPRHVLPYREVGTGENREPNRRYRVEDIEAFKLARESREGGLARRIVELEKTSAQHTAEIAELRRQLADLRGDDE